MLHEVQNSFARALRDGPDTLPNELFVGDARRVMLAMAAHANTISHGRLVALEDSFPATRRALGEGAFNQQSRAYVEEGLGLDGPLNAIGDDFPDWLERHGRGAAQVAIARFDLAFLRAHHCRDAAALALADLPQDADTLMALPLARHPAASAHSITPELLAVIEQGDWSDEAAILITRPDMAVRLFPLGAAAQDAWGLLGQPVTFAGLCANLGLKHDDAAITPAIIELVRAGALQQGTQP